jgi:flagellar motor switch protein FliN/FliY
MPDDNDLQGDAQSPQEPDENQAPEEESSTGDGLDAEALADQVLAEAGLTAEDDSSESADAAESPQAESAADSSTEDTAGSEADNAAAQAADEVLAQSAGAGGPSSILSQEDLDAILAQAGSASGASAQQTYEEPEEDEAFGAEPVDLPDFDEGASVNQGSLDMLRDISLNVKIELGHTQMYIEDILKLSPGSVVELEKLAGDPVDILVNDRLVAKGEVLILNDNFCVRIGEIITPEERLNAKII